MTGRERLLTAIYNKKPDYLPCQVHNWMQYYLNTYLKAMDQFTDSMNNALMGDIFAALQITFSLEIRKI